MSKTLLHDPSIRSMQKCSSQNVLKKSPFSNYEQRQIHTCRKVYVLVLLTLLFRYKKRTKETESHLIETHHVLYQQFVVIKSIPRSNRTVRIRLRIRSYKWMQKYGPYYHVNKVLYGHIVTVYGPRFTVQ